MRHKKLMVLGLSVILAVSTLVGCGNKGTETKVEETATTETSQKEDGEVGEATQDLGVALVINTNLGDKSICDLSYEGLKNVCEEFGVNYKCIELGGDATKQIPTLTDLAEDDNWDIIVAGTYNLKESLLEVAEEYPDKQFILYDANAASEEDGVSPEDYPNVYSMEHAQNEGSFVVGAAAAILTTSGKEMTNPEKVIGFVGGGQNTAIEDFLVGYIDGAKAIDPEIKVLISYIGDFKDTAKAKELAMAQIDQGADVVFAVAGGAGLGVLNGCAEKNVYSIGVDADQYITLKDSDPETAKHIVTSMQKKCDITVYNSVAGALTGSLQFGSYERLGLADGVVGAADNENFRSIFTQEEIDRIAEVEKQVANGEITVSTAIGLSSEEIQVIKDSVK